MNIDPRDSAWQFIGAILTLIFGLIGIIQSKRSVDPKPRLRQGGVVLTLLSVLVLTIMVWESVWWSPFGETLSLLTVALFLLFIIGGAVGLVLTSWRWWHEVNQEGAKESFRYTAMLALGILVIAVLFSDRADVLWNRYVRHIDTVALVTKGDDQELARAVKRVCDDNQLDDKARVRFICTSQPPPFVLQEQSLSLEAYRWNHGFLSALKMDSKQNPNAVPVQIAFEEAFRPPVVRSPILTSPQVVSTTSAITATQKSVLELVLDHASMAKCATGDHEAVLALGQHWRDTKYLGGAWPPLEHPAYLECLVRSAYDTHELLYLRTLRNTSPELERRFDRDRTKKDAPPLEQALAGLAYARLMMHDAQIQDAEKALDAARDPISLVGNKQQGRLDADRHRLLGDVHLARFQTQAQPAVVEPSRPPGTPVPPNGPPSFLPTELLEARKEYDAIQGEKSVNALFGLGRVNVLLSLGASDDGARKTREQAITDLRQALDRKPPGCLKQNVERWLCAAQLLAGARSESIPDCQAIGTSTRCEKGVNIQTPVRIPGPEVNVKILLPEDSAGYKVMPWKYGASAQSSTPLVAAQTGIYTTVLRLQGLPSEPFFVYGASDRPHLELQKPFQIAVLDSRNVRLDMFPMIMYNEPQLSISSEPADPVSSQAITITARVTATLAGLLEPISLTDQRILDRLTFCLDGRTSGACLTTMPKTDTAGEYRYVLPQSEPGRRDLRVRLLDRESSQDVLPARQITVEVRPAPTPVPTLDVRKVEIGIVMTNTLRSQPDANSPSIYDAVPGPCSLVRVAERAAESDSIGRRWLWVSYFSEGEKIMPVSGWVKASDLLFTRTFEIGRLPFLRSTTTRLPVYDTASAREPRRWLNECTLIEVVGPLVEEKRYPIQIYSDSRADPDPGMLDGEAALNLVGRPVPTLTPPAGK